MFPLLQSTPHIELSATNITLAVMLLGNLIGLVWGASQIKSSVNGLSKNNDKLEKTLEHIVAKQNDHEAEIRVLKNDNKKNGDEILITRQRVHDMTSDVLQPLVLMMDTMLSKMKEITNND